jgi:hypothetical protein
MTIARLWQGKSAQTARKQPAAGGLRDFGRDFGRQNRVAKVLGARLQRDTRALPIGVRVCVSLSDMRPWQRQGGY